MLHASEAVTVPAPLPACGSARSVTGFTEVWDKGNAAVIVSETSVTDLGAFRSDSANHGPLGSGMVGPHHASSITSRAAPSFSAATMPSPVLAAASTVQSAVIGARCYLIRICSLRSNPSLARMTPRVRIVCGSAVSEAVVSRA